MTTKITPNLNASGVYTLKTPWTASSSVTYTCIAVRSFQDLIQHGVDIANTYYTPNGLAQSDYQNDLAAGANLITLVSPNQPTIYVPDTYITSYPNMDTVAYNNVVLSCTLGPIPDGLSLDLLKQQVAALVSDTIGVTSTVNVHIQPSTQVITPDQAQALETARQAAITNRTTDRAKLLQAQAQIDALNQLVQQYEQLAISKGWTGNTPAPTPAPSPTPSPTPTPSP